MKKRVFVASPLAPRNGRSMEDHMRLAELLCLAAAHEGVAPYASHIFATRFLDDSKPEDRELGMAIAESFLEACDELWLFAKNKSECSSGMLKELAAFTNYGCLDDDDSRILWLPLCWTSILADPDRAIREGPRTLMWELQRARELQRQAEDAAARLIGQRNVAIDYDASETEFLLKG